MLANQDSELFVKFIDVINNASPGVYTIVI